MPMANAEGCDHTILEGDEVLGSKDAWEPAGQLSHDL